MLYSELVAELQLLPTDRIDSVRPESEGDAVTKGLEGLVVLVATLAVKGCTLCPSLVEERIGEVGT